MKPDAPIVASSVTASALVCHTKRAIADLPVSPPSRRAPQRKHLSPDGNQLAPLVVSEHGHNDGLLLTSTESSALAVQR
jgi:hypothetical protein